MSNGLNIDSSNFEEMTQSQKLNVLFQNTEHMKKSLKGWRLQLKVQWWWLSGLTVLILGLLGIKSTL